MLDELYEERSPKDSHFPEEWIMSIISARNIGREHIEEGLSRVDIPDHDITLKSLIDSNPLDFLGESHFEKLGNQTGVLVKIIDSAERLTVQVHPSREKAYELFNSMYGKTEAWYILGGREINGEPPYIFLGFKPGVTKEEWQTLFYKQDVEGMLDCMHKYYIQPGDTFLIEGGVPHAIGAGSFLVEIQEPTDYTIRTERISPSGFKINDFMCHQGIGFEKMFDCFNYAGDTRDNTLKKWKIQAYLLNETNESTEFELIGYKNTPYFRMTLLEVYTESEVTGVGVFSGLYIISGNAAIVTEDGELLVKKGEQYFIPAKLSKFIIRNHGDETLKVLRLFGPKV